MKRYYEVLVASAAYHGEGALTYSYSDSALAAGALVRVPMQRTSVMGVVTGIVSETPKFKTRDILEVYDVPPLPGVLVRLVEWLRTYYPAPLGVTVQQIVPGTLGVKALSETSGVSADTTGWEEAAAAMPVLTESQQEVLKEMERVGTESYILHGETGSGKTRVYVELVRKCLADGASALVLTPEIGLTSQLAANFTSVFGERVVVVHSGMTPKKRQETWLKIARSTVPLVVLGPRSALFSPLPHVGLIVVDESHEPAYKQEQAPHYHAVRVAGWLAHEHKATLVLGSATPGVSDYFVAEQLKKPILRMTGLAAGTYDAEHVSLAVVDLKERDEFGRSQYLSRPMLAAIDESLKRGEQSLLYLNRRGTARVILCNNCGWQAVCPHCDLPMTFHHDVYSLQCHTCGIKQDVPTACPDCGNTEVVFKVVGTKAIEAEVKRLYPAARVMRFDTDNKTAERFEKHYESVRDGEVDILVGTQLLAKGLDLPKLSTLGVVVADTSLTFPDYSAEERTYQLLTQVIGRVGRGHADASGEPIKQRIVVQSYAPERAVIQAALNRDWQTFYDNEIAERRLFSFPPFAYLLKLSCRRASSAGAESACEAFASAVRGLGLQILIEGPTPSFHTKIEGKFVWQLTMKSKHRADLLRVVELLKQEAKSGWTYDIDPINLL